LKTYKIFGESQFNGTTTLISLVVWYRNTVFIYQNTV